MAKRRAEPAAAQASSASAYTVLARRYRPQQFRELIGQEAVAQALVNAVQSGRVAHAYLFTGARGVGKTSTARILAKALNCEQGPTPTPCDRCDLCRRIAAGEDLDVLEIDGASNRGIDEVRDIRQNVHYRPSRARYKIYIIDEVHMLTKEAFNALLKTLEEPPPHVKFIFATTEAHKVPVTILSRCQRFDFAGLGSRQIAARLQEIVAAEGRSAEEAALEAIARRAGGSMRDAQSLLDQLLAFTEGPLTVAHVQRLLGTACEEEVAALAAAVLAREPARALHCVAQLAEQGRQLGELVDQLIDYWRDLMVCCAGAPQQVLSVSAARRAELQQQAARLSLDTLLAGLDILSATKARLRSSGQERVLLEMALVRLCRLEDLVGVAQLAQWLRQAETGPRTAAPPATGPRSTFPATRLSDTLSEPAKKKEDEPAPSPVLTLTSQTLPQVWSRLLEELGSRLAADLRRGQPAISAPNVLVIQFPPQYNVSREECQHPTNLEKVESALRRLTGQSWRVRCEAQAGESPDPPAAPAASARPRRPRSADAEALLQQARELLDAQVVRQDEDFGSEPEADNSE
jgi:DNA polymerase-3 subunit gamma/tau